MVIGGRKRKENFARGRLCLSEETNRRKMGREKLMPVQAGMKFPMRDQGLGRWRREKMEGKGFPRERLTETEVLRT